MDATYARNANAVGDAYLQLGCEEMSFTCAPYLLPTRPKLGDDIIWGESNAVVYSNSVRRQNIVIGIYYMGMQKYNHNCVIIHVELSTHLRSFSIKGDWSTNRKVCRLF